ncbi:MAG: hypothetical protein Q8K89_07525 [Actinomycetota bacterium]|nr:hypothetical protein [Actinomycetota bacterium]
MPATPASPKGPRSKDPVRRYIYTAAFVVALAGVVFGVSALSGTKPTPVSVPGALSEAPQADSYDVDAVHSLIASGETTKALEMLRTRLVKVPSDLEALKLIKSITDDGSPASPGNPSVIPTGSVTPGADDPFLKPIADLATLLPSAAPGYVLGSPVKSETDASVPMDSDQSGAVFSRILASVHDRGNAAGALKFVTDVSRSAYPQDAAEFSYRGIPVYFGTNGQNSATAAFARGRYVFEVIITSAGGNPAELRPIAEDVILLFPNTME